MTFSGKTGDDYALYDFMYPRSNDALTLVSPRIPAGNYCLSFWFYKTSQSSILNVQLMTGNALSSAATLWNVSNSPPNQWAQKTLEVRSGDTFQVL